ncbi:MAG: helicase-exonuclease AddAB subunit AddB [Ruminococcaceae bacterium]|nr:helicase-exonuclease AddAB subunit AddB [Oscillospiraceae bacterium]
MALTIVYGEAGTGKSTYCTEAMLSLHRQGHKVLMIVPEQYAHIAESALAEKNGYTSDEIQVTSFKRLAQKTLRKAGMLNETVSNIGKSIMLSKAILHAEKSLTLYRRAAEKPGFSDAMLSFIAECKRSAVTPKQLTGDTLGQNPHLLMKLSELSVLYDGYQQALHAKCIDDEDYVTLLATHIPNTTLFRGQHIFIDEFFRFTPAELACIRAFCLAGADLWITLGTANANTTGIFEPVQATAGQLTDIARETNIPLRKPVYLTEKHRFAQSPELAHLEAELYHYPYGTYPHATKNISLYIAPDPYTEVQAVATAICRTVSELDLHYRDIAVIAGDVELYSDLIKIVFPTYNIPVFIDQKRPLLSHPMIVMLFSLLQLMTDGLETETLLAYCKTGYVGLSIEETDILENFALSGRLKKQDWLDDKRFLQQADSVFHQTESYEETDEKKAEELLGLRNRLLDPLLALRTRLAQSRLVSDRAASIFSFFEDVGLYQTVEAEVNRFSERGELQQAREHGEIYNLLITVLDELVRCMGEEKIGLRRLCTIITAGLSQCEIATIPPGNDQVLFGDIGRSLIKNVKALFVIGANDDAFPAPPPKEGLLKDEERRLLAQNGINLGPDGKKIVVHNQYLVYNGLNISKQRLYISYAVADHEGKGRRPSSLIGRLRKIFPMLTISDNISNSPEPEKMVAGKASAWLYMLEHFHEDTPSMATLKTMFAGDEEYKNAYDTLMRGCYYTNLVENMSPTMARNLYGTSLRGSVTQLETYSRCPFSYFLQYGLRAKERKILKIDAPDIGSLLHKLVELASLQMHQNGQSFATLNETTAAQLADHTVTQLFSDLFITHLYSENRLAALMRRLKALVTKMLLIIGTHVARGIFEPCAFEVSFGENGDLPPVTIKLPTGETITLSGRIDRIDTLQQNGSVFIKIIDYKTGNKSFRLSDVYNSLSLQLAVYLIAATEGGEALFGKERKPAGMFYFRLADQTIESTSHNAEEALLKQFKMSGLLLKDIDIVRAMDKGIQGYSSILPARINKDGTLSDSSSNCATLQQFNQLSRHIQNTAGAIGREILQGGASILPCKDGQGLPCRYCCFHTICGFDPAKNPYRVAPPLRDEFVWENLEKNAE